MREAKREIKVQPRGALVRGADGRLKPATAERDVADIWAEQKRIRMREEIAEAKRKAERKAKREEWRKNLLKKKAKKTPTGDAKVIEISINMPKFHMPKVDWAKYKQKLKKVPRKAWIGAAVVFVLAVGVYIIPALSGGHHASVKTAKKVTTGKVAGTKASGPTKGSPKFDTVLPAGKSIASLGGWSLISPPGRSPVYAFADKIGNVRVDVSEQPLPDSFKNDTDKQVANLATSFAATEKLTFNGNTAYLGTSANGPQSVILSEKNLLILVKSVSTVSTNDWTAYLNSFK